MPSQVKIKVPRETAETMAAFSKRDWDNDVTFRVRDLSGNGWLSNWNWIGLDRFKFADIGNAYVFTEKQIKLFFAWLGQAGAAPEFVRSLEAVVFHDLRNTERNHNGK